LAIHQLFTTTNFAPKNAIVNWYTVVKPSNRAPYLPNISHIHTVKLKIVRETAQECNLPIMSTKQCAAVVAHFKHLKELGMKPEMA
jgi:linoleoyl-CoA desaturase